MRSREADTGVLARVWLTLAATRLLFGLWRKASREGLPFGEVLPRELDKVAAKLSADEREAVRRFFAERSRAKGQRES